ncbi:MAG: N-6 DNA methylase [Flavobacteriaceae bacterium]|nr:N-6 DNA methylase [Flavobacteriaceae bacterium]
MIHLAGHESNIHSVLLQLLKSPDFYSGIVDGNECQDWILEQENQERKRPDISSFSLKTIIEVKKKEVLNKESKPQKKAREQLKKYLETACEKQKEHDKHFIGVLTDGKIWEVYEYAKRSRELKKIKSFVSSSKHLEKTEEFIAEAIFERWKGALPLIKLEDIQLLQYFNPLCEQTLDVLKNENIWKKQFVQTKFKIWKLLLSNSGILDTKAIDDYSPNTYPLFAQHTFIVSLTRLIVAFMDNNRKIQSDDLEKYLGDGFHTWLSECPTGKRILVDLMKYIRKIDWESSVRDNLKDLYHGLIDKKNRRDFGEFYTPDHLAKDIVLEILDEDWLNDQIDKASRILDGKENPTDRQGLGVLDPSCGSGTFLFYCADRIKEHIRIHHKEKKDKISEIICMLVHGIDIHPIAVEMSKATLRMKLTKKTNDHHYRISLGNSIERKKESDFFDMKHIPTSRDGERIEINEDLYHDINFRAIAKDINDILVDKKEIDIENINPHIESFCLSLKNVIETQGNHIWPWHICNRLTIHELHKNEVSRIVGNPPWLTQKNTTDDDRRKKIKNLAKDIGVYEETNAMHADVNLSMPFTAIVIDSYLSTGGKYAWVLPDGAVKGQTWRKWREGVWNNKLRVHHHKFMDYTKHQPPIFKQSASSVVIGEKLAIEEKKPDKLHYEEHIGIDASTISFEAIHPKPSGYLKKFKQGVTCSPMGYFCVREKIDKSKGLSTIKVKKSTKNNWKGCGIDDMDVETKSLLPSIHSDDLKNRIHHTTRKWLIAPLNEHGLLMLSDNEQRKVLYPKTDEYWKRCTDQYQIKKTDEAPAELEKSGFYNSKLNKHLKDSRRYGNRKIKVVYNASGDTLRAMRVPSDVVAESKLYFGYFDSVEEAQYLVGVFNAPVMQPTWLKTRSSSRDYHRRPLQCIPIPEFDDKNKLHLKIAGTIDHIEQNTKNDQVPDFISLDPLLRELLPDYVDLKDVSFI